MYLDRVVDFLKTVPNSSISTDGKELSCACPWCDMDLNNPHSHHLSILIDVDPGQTMAYHCFRSSCQEFRNQGNDGTGCRHQGYGRIKFRLEHCRRDTQARYWCVSCRFVFSCCFLIRNVAEKTLCPCWFYSIGFHAPSLRFILRRKNDKHSSRVKGSVLLVTRRRIAGRAMREISRYRVCPVPEQFLE